MDKLAAMLIALACIAGLVAINKDILFPSATQARISQNPDYIKCKDKRLGDVEKLKKEGLIDEGKFALFSERALLMCAAQFPPANGT